MKSARKLNSAMILRLLWLSCLTILFANDVGLQVCTCDSSAEVVNEAFLRSLLRDYGTNGTLSYQELESFLGDEPVESVSGKLWNSSAKGTGKLDCLHYHVNVSQSCEPSECYMLKDVLEVYNFTPSTLTAASLRQMAPALLYMMKHSCVSSGDSQDRHKQKLEHHEPPSQLSVWGFGFLMVTVINLCSLVGVTVLPFMKLAAYRQILIFMVALAVGALAGSGLLCLIPEAFGLANEDSDDLSYIYKASTVMAGIYLFYLTEKVMQMATYWKERRNMRRNKNQSIVQTREEEEHQRVMEIVCSVKKNTPLSQDMMYKETATLPSNGSSCTQQELLENSSDESNCFKEKMSDVKEGAMETCDGTLSSNSSIDRVHVIKPLAWMIIFGDGLHNFIDGLSIGTAFTQSTLTGISVSVAVVCEELPHELGDFAILLNCGMSVKKALLYNFLSACMCYLGLIIGTLLGENTASPDWVFAIAGGMFLYISLADMMPEMKGASEVKGKQNGKQIFLIQNLGLLSGFFIMFILAVYGREINFE